MTEMKFVVKLGSEIIGFSDLEFGDPSMGCASGLFKPAPAYSAIQQYCIENSPDAMIPSLTISLPDGTCLESSGGIQITDVSPDLGDEGIEISILGIHNPPFAELFPQHMEAHYKNRQK